ncbi:unnamed protein product [Paramecium primaurelia]|uniref:Myb-like domain-containing protein n=1 Tax=Paramecium primaurelia TaxID=5886 RepID=A0A8S1MRK3_PARPR|nr:unnamed protein product [Paramecium primaurelia]
MIYPGLSVVDYQLQQYEQYPLYQNAYDFNIYPQYHYTPSIKNYESEQKEEFNKKNKNRKIKNNQPKELLPKIKEQIEEPIEQNEEILQQIIQPQYQIVDIQQGALLPKLQSHLTTEGHIINSKQIIKSTKITKKQKKENVNTGHWSTFEHTTYVNFLSQYENIMNSSMMKKTSKIFKQMSELIGTRTPSQCRSHHQKFNPYALRGDNGKRLPRSQRSRAGRKKKILFNNLLQTNQLIDNDLHGYMYEKQNYYNPFIIDYQFNENEIFIKNQNQLIQTQIQYEDYLKLRQDYHNYLEY